MGLNDANALLIKAVLESNGLGHSVVQINIREKCHEIILFDGSTLEIYGTDKPLSSSQLQKFSEILVSHVLGVPHRPNAGHPVERDRKSVV